MKVIRKRMMTVILVCSLIAGNFIYSGIQASAEAEGTIYYVDSQTGNDTNTGKSENQSWKTIGKVNGIVFEPGDEILFKAGSVWTGTQLRPQGNGTEENPIIIGKY